MSSIERVRTKLDKNSEAQFQKWYAGWANYLGLDPNPDHPAHKYDYRGAYKMGLGPTLSPEDNLYHWPSRFKDADHPNRFVLINGKLVDTLLEK